MCGHLYVKRSSSRNPSSFRDLRGQAPAPRAPCYDMSLTIPHTIRRVPPWTTLLGIALFGLALMIGAYPRALPIIGLAFAVEAALCRTAFLLVARTALQKLDPRLTTWYSLLSSTAVFAIGAAATLNWQGPHTPYGWIAALIVSVCTAVAVLTLYMSTIRIGPFRSALIMNLEPLLAALISIPLLGEVMTPIQSAGGAIMLAALVAFQLRR